MESVENSEVQQHNDVEQEDINRPLLVKSFPNSNGGFITLPFTIGCQGLGTMAYWGMAANMIIYLTKEYGMKVANGSNIINIWEATTNVTPFLAAFLADSFVGRYPMIAYGTIVINLGMVLFWLTTIIPGAKPTCDHSLRLNNCTPLKPLHLFVLYSSFALIAVGSGSCRASGLAFGADQLRFKQENGALDRFFSWYFIVIYTSLILAQTCLVYIQDHSGWVIGFGVPVLLMILSSLIFFLGTPFYITSDPKTSLLTNLAQVVVASWRNRHYDLMREDGIETMYHVVKGSRLTMPSGKLKFFNKACVIKDETKSPTPEGVVVVDSWSICTIDQVEEFKSLIKIIPLWSTGILFNLSSAQSSFQVIQANSMDRHVFTSSFQIPSASFGIFGLLTSIIWLTLCDNVIPLLASKIMKKSIHLNVKTRMGISIMFSIISFSIASIVENVRRKMATNEELTRPMPALWLLPQICSMGLASSWMITAQNEFFYSELPKSMASIASNLFYLGAAIGGLVASFIVSVVDNVTKRGDEQVSWLSNDPNKGHYDYYYGVLACLCLLNYIYFFVCRRSYDNGRLCHGEPKI